MFDPDQPAEKSDLSSAVMRSQLTSLKALIDAILTVIAAQVDGVSTLSPGEPATATVTVVGDTLYFTFGIPRGNDGAQGLPGDTGAQGPPFAQAVVDAVNTLNPGENATVSVSFDGSNVRFTFGIPRGADGSQGAQGDTGPQGPPFASAVVDGVSTLNPGDPAYVGISFDGSNVHFTFGIPRGNDGTNGTNGTDGAPGQQGPPGEVTNAQLTAAIANTAQNPSAVAPLSQNADGSYNQAQMQQVLDKLDELINATKRL